MNIFLQALAWQFIDMPKGILKGWRNFLLFNLNYFSVPILLRTFVSPWRRYSYNYGKLFEIKRNFEAFISNAMSRIIGAVLRSFFIALGFFVEVLIIVAGAIIFIGWLLLPVLLLVGFLFGLTLIF